MPLVKREITPVYLSRGLITPQGVSNELECVTNCTLSAIIRQLSNLGKHAEDIFGELYNEANTLYKRSNMLQDRIDRLSVKVTQLDATRDQVSLQDIQMRKAFKSSFLLDQEVVASHTLPSAMRDTYMRCEKPPKLAILTKYRDDGKDAMKFYTNPKYFFELWFEEMQKNITDIRERRRGRRRQRGNRTHQASGPRAVRTRKEVWAQQAHGKDLMPIQQHIQDNLSPTHTPTSDGGTPVHGHMVSDGDSSQGSMSNINDYGNHRGHQRPHARPPAPPNSQPTPTDLHQQNGSITRPMRKAPTAPQPGGPGQDIYQNQHDMYHQQQQDMYNNQQQQQQHQGFYQNHQQMPPAQPIMPPQQLTQDPMDQFPLPPDHSMANNHIPPPPPMDIGGYQNSQTPTPPPTMQSDSNNANIPPPPPPPPPPAAINDQKLPVSAHIPAPPPPPPVGMVIQPPKSSTPETNLSSSPPSNPISPTRRTSQRPTPPREQDERSDLLNAIVKGINLRKVEVKQEREKTAMPNSVEAILARRIAVELSDSEDGSSYASDSDDDEWT